MHTRLDPHQDGENIALKIVDITDARMPPNPLYIPPEEIASPHGNWTFKSYGHRVPLDLIVDRQYELWCRPSPRAPFFPARSFGYSAAVLLLGLCVAQALWVYAKSMAASEQRYQDVLKLNDEMALAKQASDDHSAAKSAFVASVSHEIRTPMNGVLGMLGLLIDTTELTVVQDDYAKTALSSGRALLSLVNDILDLSKIESSCMELETLPFSPADEMEGILSMFGERSRGKNLELATLIHGSVPPTVVGDPGRFRQIIINLIGNSLKFCNRGHIFVRIMAVPDSSEALPDILRRFHDGKLIGYGSSGSQEDKGCRSCKGLTLSGHEVCDFDCSWPSVKSALDSEAALSKRRTLHVSSDTRLLIWVEDSGMGIPEASKERIFKPFMQADKSTARKHGGTGIGLNISKKLTELMSGQLDFTSCVGKGTTFRLDLKMHLPSETNHSSSISNQSSTHRLSRPPCQPVTSPPVPRVMHLALLPSTTAPLPALCIGNNRLRAAVTLSYLARAGMDTHALILPFPSEEDAAFGNIRATPSCSGVRSSTESTSLKEIAGRPPPKVVFLEMEPSEGDWLSHTDNESRNTRNSDDRNSEITDSNLNEPRLLTLSQGSRSGFLSLRGGAILRLQRQLEWVRGLLADVRGSGEEDGEDDDRWKVRVPVVLIANVQEARFEAEVKNAGYSGVVTKPLRKAKFDACILGILGKGQQGKLQSLREDEELEESGAKGACAKEVGNRLLEGKTFMVVDDNVVNRKVASKVLEKYGAEVQCFADGADALAALAGEHTFDIVLTDIQMPGMDGFELTTAIRCAEREGRSKGPYLLLQQKGVPILAMTADVMKGSMEKLLECGMDGMVPKPIEEQRMLQQFQDLLWPQIN